ncbi:MAG: DUF1801 domain-containing protein [bacterium]
MKNTDPKVDAYIDKKATFAQPILSRLRKLFHEACPEIEETIKWGFPHFEYKGIVGSMAAFKQHVSFGFWKGQIMRDPERLFKGVGKTSMNMLKVEQLADLPADDVLIAYIKEAVVLNEKDVKVPTDEIKAKKASKELEVPDYFIAELKKNEQASKTFDNFSYSNRKEYVEWLTDAKTDATRQKRLATAIAWLAKGKPRNWKYMKKW